jgi:peptidoglycan/LPS O-acetylase OafA/YrhL
MLRIPKMVRPVIAWLGIAGIVMSVFVVGDTASFPAPWAALPVLSTAAVLAAGSGGNQRYLWPIRNPVSVWFGDISYSLYLWHFPVIVFLSALVADGTMYLIVAATAMVALAAAHYLPPPL